MKVKVVHSLALRQSAVQLFVGNEMKIVSHIVGIDTIGFEDLTNAMETEHNWRAMLIKDNLGDWAICLGDWFGMQRGISNGRRSVRGNPGFFRVTISFLRKTTGPPGSKVVKRLDLQSISAPAKIGVALQSRSGSIFGVALRVALRLAIRSCAPACAPTPGAPRSDRAPTKNGKNVCYF